MFFFLHSSKFLAEITLIQNKKKQLTWETIVYEN